MAPPALSTPTSPRLLPAHPPRRLIAATYRQPYRRCGCATTICAPRNTCIASHTWCTSHCFRSHALRFFIVTSAALLLTHPPLARSCLLLPHPSRLPLRHLFVVAQRSEHTWSAHEHTAQSMIQRHVLHGAWGKWDVSGTYPYVKSAEQDGHDAVLAIARDGSA